MNLRTLLVGVLLMIVSGVATLVLLSFFSAEQTLTTNSSESVKSTSLRFPIHEEPRPLPALSFVDGNKQKRTLASFKEKLVLLNIWATWCGPCREEMPTLDRLQAQLGSKAFEVVALSIDNTVVSTIEKFYEELNLDALAVYVDPTGSATAILNVMGIPATLLISPQGKEIGRMLGPAEWGRTRNRLKPLDSIFLPSDDISIENTISMNTSICYGDHRSSGHRRC